MFYFTSAEVSVSLHDEPSVVETPGKENRQDFHDMLNPSSLTTRKIVSLFRKQTAITMYEVKLAVLFLLCFIDGK